MEYETASVCIPPAYVERVHETYGEKINICTVIGFPNGYMTTKTKVFETRDAIENGAEARHETVPFTILRRESTSPASGR